MILGLAIARIRLKELFSFYSQLHSSLVQKNSRQVTNDVFEKMLNKLFIVIYDFSLVINDQQTERDGTGEVTEPFSKSFRKLIVL